MLQKCSNPACNAEFRYASRGRIFSFELRNPIGPCHDVPRAICEKNPSHATVSFWLCERCCSKFTLQFAAESGLSLVAAHIAAMQEQIKGNPVRHGQKNIA